MKCFFTYLEKIYIFVKDKNNLFTYSQWSCEDDSSITIQSNAILTISDEYSNIGTYSIKATIAENYTQYNQYISQGVSAEPETEYVGSCAIFNPDCNVDLILLETAKDHSQTMNLVRIHKSDNPQILSVSKTTLATVNFVEVRVRAAPTVIGQLFYADNFKIIKKKFN